MIFHEKNFQCVAGAIPLFLTPQKIGLLRVSGAFNQYIFSEKCINQILSFKGCCIKATEISRNVVVICRKEYLQHSASAAM